MDMFNPNGFAGFMTFQLNEKQLKKGRRSTALYRCHDCKGMLPREYVVWLDGVGRCPKCDADERKRLESEQE